MDKYYSTQKIMNDSRAEMWREFVSQTFVELDCTGMTKSDFYGEVRARTLSNLGISSITTDAYDVFRTSEGIAKSSDDDFLVSVQTSGTSTIRQLGREAVLSPGDFTIYDSTVPYHLHFTNRLSQLVVQIPRAQLKEYFSVPEALTALPIKGDKGIAKITTLFANTAFKESISLDKNSQDQVARTFLELLTTSLRESTEMPARQPMNATTQILRIKQFISERLKDPSLTPKLIAAHHQITVRYLQKLFESEEISPAKYIWDQRLIKAKNDLANPLLQHKSISEVCFTWAFSDTAHFSRAFKSRFELSPRAFRQTTFKAV